jgi:hypothetical protein
LKRALYLRERVKERYPSCFMMRLVLFFTKLSHHFTRHSRVYGVLVCTTFMTTRTVTFLNQILKGTGKQVLSDPDMVVVAVTYAGITWNFTQRIHSHYQEYSYLAHIFAALVFDLFWGAIMLKKKHVNQIDIAYLLMVALFAVTIKTLMDFVYIKLGDPRANLDVHTTFKWQARAEASEKAVYMVESNLAEIHLKEAAPRVLPNIRVAASSQDARVFSGKATVMLSGHRAAIPRTDGKRYL